MSATLGPMSLGEILDRAIQILKANLWLFFGIAALPGLAQLGNSLCQEFAQGRGGNQSTKALAFVAALVFLIAEMILSPMAGAAKCWATSQIVFDKAATAGSAYGTFRARKGRLLGLGIVQGLMSFWPVIPAAIVLGIIFGAIIPHSGASGILVSVFLACVPCFPLYARYLLAFPATAILDTDVHHSLRRSVELGRGFRWKVFWSYALPAGIAVALGAGGGGLFGWVKTFHPLSYQWLFLWSAMGHVWVFLVTLIFGPLGSIALTLTYYDLCVRKEGLDVALMMEQAGMTADTAYAAQEPTDAVGDSWAQAPYREPAAGEASVGIPWSVLAAKDAVALEDETEKSEDKREPGDEEQPA